MSENPWADKIVITGTGRSGTSLLMQLFTAMGEDTGFGSPVATIQKGSNAGMERTGTWAMSDKQVLRLPQIIKDPRLSMHLSDMAERGHKPGHVIWCWRELEHVAQSRLAANRPWFPDNNLSDLSQIPRDKWPKWATEKNQKRAMAEVLGNLANAIIGHGLRHTTMCFPDDALEPAKLWKCLCGVVRRGSVGEALNWRTQDDFDRFIAAWDQVVKPDMIRFG